MSVLVVTVCLECDDGEHVGLAHIGMGPTPPPVIKWGERVFCLHEELTYREIFPVEVPLDGVR